MKLALALLLAVAAFFFGFKIGMDSTLNADPFVIEAPAPPEIPFLYMERGVDDLYVAKGSWTIRCLSFDPKNRIVGPNYDSPACKAPLGGKP